MGREGKTENKNQSGEPRLKQGLWQEMEQGGMAEPVTAGNGELDGEHHEEQAGQQ